MAIDQAGFDQQPQMAGDARLRLAENGDELADGELGLGEERQQPQARHFAGCFETGEKADRWISVWGPRSCSAFKI